MKTYKLLGNCVILLSIGSFALFFAANRSSALTNSKKQIGNTISGYVFGGQRQPIPNTDVELSDDFSRTIGRVKTNSSGRYVFNNIAAGKYRVKVLPYETNYEEQTQEVEITNYTRQSSTGVISRGGLENSQLDFYLRVKKGASSGVNAVIFVQEVPKEAKSKYDAGVANLNLKKSQEGLSDIKSAIEIFPTYFDALILLGNEYVKLNYYEAAQVLLTKAVEVNPKSYRGWYGLAYVNYSLKQTTEALAAIEKALNLSPEAVEAIILNGTLLKQEKKYDASLIQLNKAKEIAKGSVPEVNWQLALLYGNNLKLYNKAADELEIFLKAQPDSKDSEMIRKLIKTFREKAQK